MLVYLVRLSITELVVVTVVITCGELHSVLTVTGTSTSELSSTVQVRLGEDPAIIAPTGEATVTEVGSGTETSNVTNNRITYQEYTCITE